MYIYPLWNIVFLLYSIIFYIKKKTLHFHFQIKYSYNFKSQIGPLKYTNVYIN